MTFEFVPGTFLVQLAIFASLVFILKYLYFDPIIRLLQKRDALTVGRLEESSQLEEEIGLLAADYQTRLQEFRQKLEDERSRSVKIARDETEKKIREAQVSLQKKLSDAERSLEQEVIAARGQVKVVAGLLAKEISNAVMTAKVVRS